MFTRKLVVHDPGLHIQKWKGGHFENGSECVCLNSSKEEETIKGGSKT